MPHAGWGFLRFFPRKQLMAGLWAARDEVRFEANVSLVTSIFHTADPHVPGGTHMSSIALLQAQMDGLLASSVGSDLTLHVWPGARGETTAREYKAHSNILIARSSYFRIMLGAHMRESSTRIVWIDFCRPSVLHELMRYSAARACHCPRLPSAADVGFCTRVDAI